MAKNYLSPLAFQSLKDELRKLLEEERPQVVEQVSAAAALGDRSENAEYLYGKRRLREINRRIRFLQSRLSDVEVVEAKDEATTEIRFASWVKVENEKGEVRVFQIIGPDEVDASGEKITFTSPLGRALLGKRRNDQVIIEGPKGKLRYIVLGISAKKDIL